MCAGLLLLMSVVVPRSMAGVPLAARIVNGDLTSDYLTTVAVLSGAVSGSADSHCTGTLVGCSTVLTAAHCVCSILMAPCQGATKPSASDYSVFLQHYGFVGISDITVNDSYNGFTLVGDLALITLDEAVTGITPTSLVTTSPALGTRATIVGFGRSGGSAADYGLKRFGQVTTSICNNGSDESLCWDFTCSDLDSCADANTCNGDSGGPLLVTAGEVEKLAGVTSSGLNAECLADDHSYDTSVAYWSDWITANASETLGTDSCGDVPHFGVSARVETSSTSGALTSEDLSDIPEVVVAAGTGELRLAVNATDSGAENFSVHVKQGAPPTTSDYDCRMTGTSQYAFCGFTDPAPGTWYVNIAAVSGSGQWQLTSTQINSGSGTGCGDPSGNEKAQVSDALAILKKAVNIPGQCRPCNCDIDSDGAVKVTDALQVLKTAVGIDVVLDCLACVDSTTTTTLP
jgi:secreted trypsin-like serine protease